MPAFASLAFLGFRCGSTLLYSGDAGGGGTVGLADCRATKAGTGCDNVCKPVAANSTCFRWKSGCATAVMQLALQTKQQECAFQAGHRA